MSPWANPCAEVKLSVSAMVLSATVASTPVTSSALAPLLFVNECVPVDQSAAVRSTVVPSAMKSVVVSTATSPLRVTLPSEFVPLLQGSAAFSSTT